MTAVLGPVRAVLLALTVITSEASQFEGDLSFCDKFCRKHEYGTNSKLSCLDLCGDLMFERDNPPPAAQQLALSKGKLFLETPEGKALSKRQSSFVRIGRTSSFVRMGRGSADGGAVKRASSFVRIGRGENNVKPSDAHFDYQPLQPPNHILEVSDEQPLRVYDLPEVSADNARVLFAPSSLNKRASSFVRIGRGMMLGGRPSRASSFVRIGRATDDGRLSVKRASSFVRIGRAPHALESSLNALRYRLQRQQRSPTYKRLSSFVRIGKRSNEGNGNENAARLIMNEEQDGVNNAESINKNNESSAKSHS